MGRGSLIFGNADTRIRNHFLVQEGAVIFRAEQSTVNVLDVAAGGFLDLRGGGMNAVFINNGSVLEGGSMGFDFAFDDIMPSAKWNDILLVGGAFRIEKSTVYANIVSHASVHDSSLPFIKSASLDVNVENLSLVFSAVSQIEYHLESGGGILWLVLGNGGPWEDFVYRYLERYAKGLGSDAIVLNLLGGDIEAMPYDRAIDPEQYLNLFDNFTIDGQGFSANSKGLPDLGFIVKNSSLTFKDISLTSFNRTRDHENGNGAAMNIVNSKIFMRGDFAFINNKAEGYGGAVYVENSSISFSPNGADSQILFKGNSARRGVDIYADNSFLIFDAADFSVNLSNGMRMEGHGKIIKTGAKELIFEGEDSKLLDLEIREGKTIFNAPTSSAGFVMVSSKTVLSLAGGGFNRLFVDRLISSGTLELDLNFSRMAALGDAFFGGRVVINTHSFLAINPIGRDRWLYGSSTTIVFAANPLSLDIDKIYYDRSLYRVFQPSPNALSIMYRGPMPNLSKQFDLTHNQNEAYQSLKRFDDLRRNGGYGSFKNAGDTFEQEMDEIIIDTIEGKSEQEIKRSLDALSGSFLAQTIVQIALDNPHKLLYSKANPFSFAGLPARDDNVRSLWLMSLWGDLGAKFYQTKDDENLLGIYETRSIQAAVGGNFIESADLAAGVFANFARTQMKQGGDRADVQNFEGGIYGGIFTDYLAHRYFTSMGYHNAATARRIDLGSGYVPTANFELYSFKGGGETMMPLSISMLNEREIDAHLFGGLTASSIYNEKIKEKGGGPIGLTVKSGFYHRLDGYMGLRMGRRKWHVSAEIGYLLYGNLDRSHFAMHMDGLYHRMDIEGSTVDPLSFGLNFGTDKRINDDFYLQTLGGISADIGFGGRRAYVNVSVKYLFPSKRDEQVYRELMGEYLYTSKEKLDIGRREVLLDEKPDWGRSDKTIEPDIKAEDAMQKNSDGENRIAVHIAAGKENANMAWTNFMIVDMGSFGSDSAEVPTGIIKIIKNKMDSLDKSKTAISRVRIIRYGRFIEEQERLLAGFRAENIYKEMGFYRSELDKLEQERLEKEQVEKLRKEEQEKQRLRLKEEQIAQKLMEAEQRRRSSIASFKLRAATFQTGLAILSKEAFENINAIAVKIKNTKYRLVTVEGHADSTGLEERNLRLSEERARAVYLELALQGIPKDKLRLVYFGSSMPIDTNATVEGREANRRVEIFVE